jgi:sugar phosphate isomerase/epimerase
VNGVGDLAEARRLLAFAKRARIPVLSVMPDAEVLGPELDALLAANPDTKLAIHNHGPELPYEKIAEVEAAFAGRHPSLGACVDTGHFIRSGEDPAEAIRRFGSRVHGVHLKDFASEGVFAEGRMLGRGKLDLEAVFRALRDVGYRGAVSLEYEEHPENVVPDLVACLEAASEAAERVNTA